MRFSKSARDVAAGLTDIVGTPSARARIIPLALMLVLALNGVGPCLCTGESVHDTADPHACCEHMKSDASGSSTAKTAAKPCSQPCAGHHSAPALAASSVGDQLKAVPLTAALAIGAPVAQDVPVAIAALDAAQHHSPPPRTSVLRI